MLPVTLSPDPPVRPDGRCALCEEPKPTANAPSLRANHLAQLAADPFCSAICARTYHRVDGTSEDEQGNVETANRMIERRS
jgi:hypothetical protein